MTTVSSQYMFIHNISVQHLHGFLRQKDFDLSSKSESLSFQGEDYSGCLGNMQVILVPAYCMVPGLNKYQRLFLKDFF